ncbi:MAG: tyrosine--tRNA ligase [Bifidobacterium aquikefiri]|uniref:Tyrosine--tRNA ligase n=1 Tax=Bifidobacterium aquikefiri TaxID=1653207 RepID=A0A261G2M2_9BIFI|nr:tyrosine--tRNA ligase [Bifidobacterium aquikefiri]OZG65423.1 tyrosine--tRNA ligase [Bifidobacterium aquikefiri]
MVQVTNYRQAGFDSLSDELQWRGLLAQHTDETRLFETLDGKPISFYAGFDPTAASLHIGNLVQLINMRHLQAAGHTPYALVGGATGLIGDPRESGERTLNPAEIVEQWAERLRQQISRFLSADGDNGVQFVNNLDWTAKMSVIDFLRDVGKNFRLGTMLNKDIVSRRLNSDEGISFTEFSYQVLQGNDFLHLFDTYGCVLELGGNDQWGNLVSGLDLIHKMRGENVSVMTSPIITDAQGKKFGKSEGGAIWLDPTMLSPYRFYQFWFNQPDDQVIRLLKYFTFLPKQEIEHLETEVAQDPGARHAQKVLAWEVTSFVHGEHATQQAIDAASALFGRGADLHEIDGDTLAASLDGVKVALGDGTGKDFAPAVVGERLVEAAVSAGLFASVSQVRKIVASGGMYLNNARVELADTELDAEDFLQGGFAVIRRGKKTIGAVRLQK